VAKCRRPGCAQKNNVGPRRRSKEEKGQGRCADVPMKPERRLISFRSAQRHARGEGGGKERTTRHSGGAFTRIENFSIFLTVLRWTRQTQGLCHNRCRAPETIPSPTLGRGSPSLFLRGTWIRKQCRSVVRRLPPFTKGGKGKTTTAT